MSDARRNPPREDAVPHETHEGPIKTPKQLILAVFFAFVIPIVVILLLAIFVTTGERSGAGSDTLGAEAVAKRLQRVGSIEIKDMNDPASLKNGEQVFAAQCSACHTAGVAGAPKFGDTAAWGPRLGQGYATLLEHALKGKGAMGPQGGGDFSDLEVGRAVVYMANKGGAKFEEPKAAPVTSAASAGDAPTATAAPAAPAPEASATTVAAAAATPPPAAAPKAEAAPVAAGPGAVPALYTQICATCHAAGIAGAPKVGDKAAWGPRLAAGIDGLTASAIKGKGAMPPRGGSAGTDTDIKAVVTYFVNSAK